MKGAMAGPDRFGVKRWSTLVGRDSEMTTITDAVDDVLRGNGKTVFLEGEAGIGKSRLISEMRDYAEGAGVRMLIGRGLEGASPFMPFVNAFKDVGPDLISPGEMSIIEEVFLLDPKGRLLAHAARTLRSETDERTFGRVFATIKDFMSRSFDDVAGDGELNELQYGNFMILFEDEAPLYLAVVVSGGVSDDLKIEMSKLVRNLAREYSDGLRDWAPGKTVPSGLENSLKRFAAMEFRSEKRLEVLDPRREQDRMFDSVLNLLLGISRVRPVVLVLDDMQWLDDSSLDLLHYISRNIRDSRVLIVGAYRPEEGRDPETGHTLRLTEVLHRMNRERLYSSIRLRRLTRAETVEMLSSIFPKNDFPTEFSKRLHEETEGNPFFVEEIIGSLLLDGVIYEDKALRAWRVKEGVDISLPSTIRDVVLRRMDRLDEEYRRILDTAAVMGMVFDIENLRKVMDADEEELIVALDELADLRLVKEVPGGDRYAFDHGVIQEVIYENMSRNRRRMVHKKVAAVLEKNFTVDPDSVVYDLARHYSRTRDHNRAFYYTVRAAKRAQKLYALKEARMYYADALENLSKQKDLENRTAMEVMILNDASEICYFGGDVDDAKRYTQRVLDIAPSKGLYADMARAYRLRGNITEITGDWKEGILDLEAAVEISDQIGDEVGKLWAYEMLGMIHWRMANYDKALEYLNEAIRGAEKFNEDILLANALITKGNIYNVKGDLDETIRHYERGLTIARAANSTFEIMRAYNNLGDVFMSRNKLDIAEGYFLKCQETAEKCSDQRFVAYCLNNLAECAHKRGDVERAKAYGSHALDIFTKLDEKAMVANVYIDFGIIHTLDKNWAEAAVCFDIAIDALETLGHQALLGKAHSEYGHMSREKGDRVNAISHFERALDIYRKAELTGPAKDIERELVNIRRGDDFFKVDMVGRGDIVRDLKGLLDAGVGLVWDTADVGPGVFVLLEAQQGLGKSRVVEEVLKHARSKGVTVIEGECLRSELGSPYYPFIQALAELFQGRDPDSLKRFLRRVPLEILAILPGADRIGTNGGYGEASRPIKVDLSALDLEEGAPSDLGALKDQMFETLSRLLLELGEPLALFIEDLQYADVSSMQLLHHMASEILGSKIFMMATYAPDAIVIENSFSENLEKMEKAPSTRMYRLEPLDVDQVKELISRFLDIAEVPDNFAEKVHERTKGNPLFVEEVLKILPKGLLAADLADLDLEPLHVPESILDLIAGQMARLSPEEREMLEYAAVAGSVFKKDLLFEAMGLGMAGKRTKDQEGVLERLEETRYLKVLDENTMTFGHPMVQQVIYETVPLEKRRNMHRAFGRAIERENKDTLEKVAFDMAYHYSKAGSSEKGFKYSIMAGLKAEAMFAPKEAEGYFMDAIKKAHTLTARMGDETSISSGEVLSARHHLHAALMAQGKLDEAKEVSRISLSMARDVRDRDREAQALMDIGEIANIKSSWMEAKSMYERARVLCNETGFMRGLFRAHKGLAWNAWRMSDFENAFVHAKKCIEIGQELNDLHLVAQGHLELGSAHGEKGDYEEAIKNLNRAKAIFEAAGDKSQLARIYNNLGVTYRDKGDPKGAVSHFEKSVDIAKDIGGIRMIAYCMSNLSECWIMIGNLSKAKETASKGLSIFIKLDEPYMVSSCYRRMGMIARIEKDFPSAEGYLTKARKLVKGTETPLHTAELTFELALIAKEKGDIPTAIERFNTAKDLFASVDASYGLDKSQRELDLILSRVK